jgi:hypothetical protein
MAAFLCLKMTLRKNFSTKRGSCGQFLIRIRIQDSDPDPNPGFESGSKSGSGSGFKTNCRPDPDPTPDPKLLFRIRNTEKVDPKKIYMSKFLDFLVCL